MEDEPSPPNHAVSHGSPQDERTATAALHVPDDTLNADGCNTAGRCTANAVEGRQDFHVTDAPPFWTRHGRSVSSVSYHSINGQRPAPITLEDRSFEENEVTQGCWAKSVSIDDFTIVSGATGIGAYVVWHCTVATLKGGDLEMRKRYSEFDRLRTDLVRAFPHAEAMIPQLPRKSTVSRFRPRFLESRKAGLAHFMNCVLLNPEFAASPILKDFIFS
ncbi:hypothetical protein BAUCODRAFT_34976 [Baudoinia panamericana UAMH 10762]|uniref:Endosomal/vacuolar adapter protein YPT35 n=1 Tax=Baudoinia panamericana (strain UAMH 10762) TaxID=717646 RepID=M2MEH7_BAUPA|nr:uncharacterized protein BAUCODRAFT_34976 [Baudoinia panamericana UAMH 10762]EMC94976.1 hypothetical protein BAUCODRAFT_34976 [Baudoinia panamericana UAMH 10762]